MYLVLYLQLYFLYFYELFVLMINVDIVNEIIQVFKY